MLMVWGSFKSHLKQKKKIQTWMASLMMADYGEHIYIKKVILQLNITKSQSVHIDFMIYLHNLGDKESEKPKRPMSTSWLL